jgi:hypothetical protein
MIGSERAANANGAATGKRGCLNARDSIRSNMLDPEWAGGIFLMLKYEKRWLHEMRPLLKIEAAGKSRMSNHKGLAWTQMTK